MAGQFGVAEDVFLVEGLLDEEEVVRVEAGQVAGVGDGVRGVGVDLEEDVVAEAVADGGYWLDVPAWLDFQLDAEVALVEVVAYGVQ